MIMLGQNGSRFWLHYDNTVLASWQAIVKGRKRFFVCPPSEGMSVHGICVSAEVLRPTDGVCIGWVQSKHLAELVLPKRSTGKMSKTGNSRINPFDGPDQAAATTLPPAWAQKIGVTEPSSQELWGGLSKAMCYDDVIEEGEILFYPHKWCVDLRLLPKRQSRPRPKHACVNSPTSCAAECVR
eukprot:COSAG02_NODE_16099_length_1113_cov_1.328402_1_plen_183_part_00